MFLNVRSKDHYVSFSVDLIKIEKEYKKKKSGKQKVIRHEIPYKELVVIKYWRTKVREQHRVLFAITDQIPAEKMPVLSFNGIDHKFVKYHSIKNSQEWFIAEFEQVDLIDNSKQLYWHNELRSRGFRFTKFSSGGDMNLVLVDDTNTIEFKAHITIDGKLFLIKDTYVSREFHVDPNSSYSKSVTDIVLDPVDIADEL